MTAAWEDVCDSDEEETTRLAVPGGWIYKTVRVGSFSLGQSVTTTVAMCFVQDNSGHELTVASHSLNQRPGTKPYSDA